jgi:flagellar motor switch/type III secretory pathway protein FliN
MECSIRPCSADDLFLHTNRNPASLPGLAKFACIVVESAIATLSRAFGATFKVVSMPEKPQLLNKDKLQRTDIIEFGILAGSPVSILHVFLPKDMWTHLAIGFFGGTSGQTRNDDLQIDQGAYRVLYLQCRNEISRYGKADIAKYLGSRKEDEHESEPLTKHFILYQFDVEADGSQFAISVSIPGMFANRYCVEHAADENSTMSSNRDLVALMDAEQELSAVINIQNVEIQRIFEAAAGQAFLLGEVSDATITIEYEGASIGIGKLIERNGKYAIQIV